MGSKGGDAPKSPDPAKTAAAQTSTNIGTAIANSNMGNVNQVTPDGNLTYSQSGTYAYKDPNDGKTYDIPQYTATQTLSPQQQAIKDQTTGAQLNLGALANDQSSFLKDYMAKPIDLNNDATESRLMELGRKRLDPVLAQRQQGLEQSLADRGVKMGSSAYDRAMELNTQGSNDAYNQLLLSGRGQATQEALTERNQPINEITALLSGSQVSQPNFVNAGQPSIPTTDIAGLTQQQFQNQLGIYNAENGSNNAMMGGLFSMGGSLGSSAIRAWSDVRLKKDISRVGEVNGMGLYLFRYLNETDATPLHLGLMAQEVLGVVPDAVEMDPSGYMKVNYTKALGGVH